MDRKKPIDGLFSPIERPSRARWVRDGRMSRADDWRGLLPGAVLLEVQPSPRPDRPPRGAACRSCTRVQPAAAGSRREDKRRSLLSRAVARERRSHPVGGSLIRFPTHAFGRHHRPTRHAIPQSHRRPTRHATAPFHHHPTRHATPLHLTIVQPDTSFSCLRGWLLLPHPRTRAHGARLRDRLGRLGRPCRGV